MFKVTILCICLLFVKTSFTQNTLYPLSIKDLRLSSEKTDEIDIKEKLFLEKMSKKFINNNTFKTILDTSLLKNFFSKEINEINYEKSGHISSYTVRSFLKFNKAGQEAAFIFYFFDSIIIRKVFQFTFPPHNNPNEYKLDKSHVKSLESILQKNSFRFNPKINSTINDTIYLDIIKDIQNKNRNFAILPLIAKQYSDTIDCINMAYASFGFSIFKYFFPYKEILATCNWNILKQLASSPNLCIRAEAIDLIKLLNSDSSIITNNCKTLPQNIFNNDIIFSDSTLLCESYSINTKMKYVSRSKVYYSNIDKGQAKEKIKTIY